MCDSVVSVVTQPERSIVSLIYIFGILELARHIGERVKRVEILPYFYGIN